MRTLLFLLPIYLCCLNSCSSAQQETEITVSTIDSNKVKALETRTKELDKDIKFFDKEVEKFSTQIDSLLDGI